MGKAKKTSARTKSQEPALAAGVQAEPRLLSRRKVWGLGAALFGLISVTIGFSNVTLEVLAKILPANVEARIVKAYFQEKQVDVVAIRVSNPSTKGDSLSEPAFQCVEADQSFTLRSVWYEPAGDNPLPSFPPGTRFPLNVAPTSTVEATVLVFKAPGSSGLRDCTELRFSWIDANGTRRMGAPVKGRPNTGMVVFMS